MDEVARDEPLTESALAVTADAQGVWAGRRLVESALRLHAGDAAAVTGGIVARELLANAIEHGQEPVAVRVTCFPDHARIEVHDGSRSGPVPTRGGAPFAGSRGLGVVERLCRRWGNHRRRAGKTMWAELEFGGAPQVPADPEELALFRLWLEGEDHQAERYPVVLENVPVALLLRSQARVAALLRPDDPGARDIPPQLREQLREAAQGLRPVRDALVREALVAAARGAERATLVLHLPPGVGAAVEAFSDLLDAVDRRADAAGSAAAVPAEERALRRWCVRCFVRQLPASVPDGRADDPAVEFDG